MPAVGQEPPRISWDYLRAHSQSHYTTRTSDRPHSEGLREPLGVHRIVSSMPNVLRIYTAAKTPNQ